MEVYSQSETEADKVKVLQIAERNLDIARKYYGSKSLYLLKHELALASNKITSMQFQEA